jgi:hypothetical protein
VAHGRGHDRRWVLGVLLELIQIGVYLIRGQNMYFPVVYYSFMV